MAKSLHNDVLDAALNIIKNNCTRVTLCSQEPTTYNEANATYVLVSKDGYVSGDFTISDGDTSGRKVRVAAKTGITPTNAGTANHVALLDVTNSKLLGVTTMTAKAVATDDLVDIAAFDLELADPT
jgi:hypothetical protein